jgi:hypothetical protein
MLSSLRGLAHRPLDPRAGGAGGLGACLGFMRFRKEVFLKAKANTVAEEMARELETDVANSFDTVFFPTSDLGLTPASQAHPPYPSPKKAKRALVGEDSAGSSKSQAVGGSTKRAKKAEKGGGAQEAVRKAPGNGKEKAKEEKDATKRGENNGSRGQRALARASEMASTTTAQYPARRTSSPFACHLQHAHMPPCTHTYTQEHTHPNPNQQVRDGD